MSDSLITKVLVANRGEIARRIFRTCREMGIATVAVFSDPDRHSPFVAEADEAYHLGGSTPADSYLRIDALLEAARQTGADAIHPGYGFLSENAGFAQAVIDAGLVWIGPTPESMISMGSKLQSKLIAHAARVPCLPNFAVDDQIAAEHFPLLVKASAGGGGKGMRIVERAEDLAEAVASAEREATSAFGDGTVFLERYLKDPRHIEIQVLGDQHGQVATLFERECSIQRRHQKIVEEAPSPVLDDPTRDRMAEAATALCRQVGYVGAGTVEFIFDQGEFFFLEMNTRLQVEHPVTEEITGIDLVRWQIKVARGEPLDDEVLDPARVGHAIEVRLYAEDPENDFLPVSGTIERFQFPQLPGLRVESGVEDGSVISPFYDPMIAKVIAWGESREEAAAILSRGLQTAAIHGPVNNRDLLLSILRHPEFLAGETDTGFLTRNPPEVLGRPSTTKEELKLALVAAALTQSQARREQNLLLPQLPSGFRNNPSQLNGISYGYRGEVHRVGYGFDPLRAEVDGQPIEVALHHLDRHRVGLESGRRLLWFAVSPSEGSVHVDGPSGYLQFQPIARFPDAAREDEAGSLNAPMPGRVIKVTVDEGDRVEEGQALVVLEAMKMEHMLRAPHPGTVRTVQVAPGDQVEAGQVLVVVD